MLWVVHAGSFCPDAVVVVREMHTSVHGQRGSACPQQAQCQHHALRNAMQSVSRRDMGGGHVELRHGPQAQHTSQWLVVTDSFQPSVDRRGMAVDESSVSLAFSLSDEAPVQQQVFAFLPLRSYGLRFIVQVSLAALLAWKTSLSHQAPIQQPAFAFLPLCSYGLRKSVQVVMAASASMTSRASAAVQSSVHAKLPLLKSMHGVGDGFVGHIVKHTLFL